MQLGELQTIEGKISELGFQIVALSPDKPEVLKPFQQEKGYDYRLFSDHALAAARAFGIAFRLDDDTAGRYKAFGVDLHERSGEGHQGLPVPGVFVVNAEGVIEFSFVNPDYRVRLAPEVLLAAVRAAVAE